MLGNYDEAVAFYLPTCGCNIEWDVDKMNAKNSLHWSAQHTSDENKEFLRGNEEQVTLEIEGYKILLTHASPYSINDYIYESDRETRGNC